MPRCATRRRAVDDTLTDYAMQSGRPDKLSAAEAKAAATYIADVYSEGIDAYAMLVGDG